MRLRHWERAAEVAATTARSPPSRTPAAASERVTEIDQTGLPWINPSPNIRSLTAALSFSGLVMLETTNLNVGRGTDAQFSYVGAPYVNGEALLRRMRAYDLPGVRFELADWTPRGAGWMQFAG